MKHRFAAAVFGACAALSAFPGAAAAPGEPAPAVDEAQASRQLLVMMRMPLPHFRAGAAYDGNYPADSSRPARRRAAQELASEHHLRIIDDWPMPVIGVDCFVMEHAPDAELGVVLAALARDPRVAWAQPVNLFHGQDGGDPLYPVQPDAKYWHLAELHRLSTGRGVRIAVVDSGVDVRHPDLARQVELQENFVDERATPPERHGTAVAGIVAAREGNGIGISGVAPDARLMALRACWQAPGKGTLCSSFTLGKALNFAIMHDARIINLSLGGPADRLLDTLLAAAAERGMAVVGALDPARPAGGFPASSPGVITVAAQAPVPPPARAALLAPGTDIPTCEPGARWGFVSGSSYAAAHVSGLLALLAQLRPAAGPGELKHDIIAGGMHAPIEPAGNRGAHSANGGTIDACATIARAAGACACSCPSIGALKASSQR
jgi:subtilisin family serine protease